MSESELPGRLTEDGGGGCLHALEPQRRGGRAPNGEVLEEHRAIDKPGVGDHDAAVVVAIDVAVRERQPHPVLEEAADAAPPHADRGGRALKRVQPRVASLRLAWLLGEVKRDGNPEAGVASDGAAVEGDVLDQA